MTIVTVDLTGASPVGALLAGSLRATALGVLDRLLAGRAAANAAEAVEECHLRRRHRRLEESEMMLLCLEGGPAAGAPVAG